MVVVHVDGDDMWRALGLEGFASLPEVGTDVWQALKVRKDAVGRGDQWTRGCALPRRRGA